MWKWIQRQSSPKIFYQTCSNLTPWFFWPFIGFLVIGLYWALIVSPADYQQGDGYRIIFIHVILEYFINFRENRLITKQPLQSDTRLYRKL